MPKEKSEERKAKDKIRRDKFEKMQKPGWVKGGKYAWDEEEEKDGR